MTTFPWTEADLHARVMEAVRHYWTSRGEQRSAQAVREVRDTGLRNEVTGGGHLDGFCHLLAELTHAAGFLSEEVRVKSGLELPGFFRATKKWDVIVYRNQRLCAALEMKSQAGPSFGNNANNRTEEAIGNAVDLRHAFQAGAVGKYPPFIGYFFLLEDHPRALKSVSVSGSIFKPLPEFANASYAKRYELLIGRLVEKRIYDAGALILAPRGGNGAYSEPNPRYGFTRFAKAFFSHLVACN